MRRLWARWARFARSGYWGPDKGRRRAPVVLAVHYGTAVLGIIAAIVILIVEV